MWTFVFKKIEIDLESLELQMMMNFYDVNYKLICN